ncbi:hypothetical protein ASPBRDRAFT_44978, partial [Aspergillus brasiliensis CBS 101740]
MARRAPGCLPKQTSSLPRVLQFGVEKLRIAFVSRLTHQSTLLNGSGPRKEKKEVENRDS